MNGILESRRRKSGPSSPCRCELCGWKPGHAVYAEITHAGYGPRASGPAVKWPKKMVGDQMSFNGCEDISVGRSEIRQLRKRKFSNFGPAKLQYIDDDYKNYLRSNLINNKYIYHESPRPLKKLTGTVETPRKPKNSSTFHQICHRIWNNLKDSIDPYFEKDQLEDNHRSTNFESRSSKRLKTNYSRLSEPTGLFGRIKKQFGKVPVVSKEAKLSLGNQDIKFAQDAMDDFEKNKRKSIMLNSQSFFGESLFKQQQKPEVEVVQPYGSSITRRKKFKSRERSKIEVANSADNDSVQGFLGIRDSVDDSLNDIQSLSQIFNSTKIDNSIREPSKIDESTRDSGNLFKNEIVITKVRSIPRYAPVHYISPSFTEYKKILDKKKKLHEEVYKLHLDEEKKGLKELESKQLAKVYDIWKSRENLVVTSLANIDIRTSDLFTLKDKQWLNDNIMDSYLSMIVARSKTDKALPEVFVFTTHFYSTLLAKGYNGVRRWAKRLKVNVTALDYVYIPVNVMNSHWSLAVINNKHKKLQYFDSLNGHGGAILENLRQYMIEESGRLYPENQADYSDWSLEQDHDYPQQKNGSDCGVFVCTGVNYLSQEIDLTFGQPDMQNIRRRMVYEIVTNKLLD